MSEMKPYIVRQGEYLAKIAFACGFDADDVWNHEKNDELSMVRPDAQVLAPGDLLRVSARHASALGVVCSASNSFVGKVPQVEVPIELRVDGKPLSNEACVVEGFGQVREMRTDGSGLLVVSSPVTVPEFIVRVPRTGANFRILIGFLDPVDSATGRAARLSNLGYLPEIDGTQERLPEAEVNLALRHFIASLAPDCDADAPDAVSRALLDAAGV